MMRTPHANKELGIIEKLVIAKKATVNDAVKVLCIIAKLVRDMKCNQVTIMKGAGLLNTSRNKTVVEVVKDEKGS